MKNTLFRNPSTPSDSSVNHPNSEFSRSLPFLDFVYRTDGINGLAQLYRSVVCQSNCENPEKLCYNTSNLPCPCPFSHRKEKKNPKITRGQKGFKEHQIANKLSEGLNSLAGQSEHSHVSVNCPTTEKTN